MIKTISITVKGRVQGVGYRHFTRMAAKDYNIKGLVKNQIDGSVYIEAEGKNDDLELFVEYCKKGPAWARVDEIIVEEIQKRNFKEFVTK